MPDLKLGFGSKTEFHDVIILIWQVTDFSPTPHKAQTMGCQIEDCSGSVVQCYRLWVEGSPKFGSHSRHCVVSLSKTLYPLLSTGANPEEDRKTSCHADMTEKLLTGK